MALGCAAGVAEDTTAALFTAKLALLRPTAAPAGKAVTAACAGGALRVCDVPLAGTVVAATRCRVA